MTSISKKRITLFLNPAIIKQARAQAVVEDLNLTNLMEKALISYLPSVTIIKKVKQIWREKADLIQRPRQ